jgi:hypothetical protein
MISLTKNPYYYELLTNLYWPELYIYVTKSFISIG